MLEELVSIEQIRKGLFVFEDGGRCIKVVGRTFVKLRNDSEVYEKKEKFKRDFVCRYTDDNKMLFEVWKVLNRDYYLQTQEFKQRSYETMYFLLKLFSDIEEGLEIDEVSNKIEDHLSSFKTML